MQLAPLLQRLSSVVEPAGTVVTLTLDVSQSGILPAATRIFLKDELPGHLSSKARPPRVRASLERAGRRIRDHVDGRLRPGADGLFLAAGRSLFEAVELHVPLRNFVHVGRSPYLAPLLEAEARSPRAYVVECHPGEIRIGELHLGERTEHAALERTGRERDIQRQMSGRTVLAGPSGGGVLPAFGGSERDRHRQRLEEDEGREVAEAASRVRRLLDEAAAEAVFFFGRRDLFTVFQGALPAGTAERAVYGGPMGRLPTTEPVRREVERRARERVESELVEFVHSRSQGHLASLGPRQVLERLSGGTVRRVYLDALDPVPGLLCLDCGTRYPGLQERCDYCEGDLAPVSMTQEVVAQALAHPPMELTFVPGPAGWLRDLGGMAALVSKKAFRRRR